MSVVVHENTLTKKPLVSIVRYRTDSGVEGPQVKAKRTYLWVTGSVLAGILVGVSATVSVGVRNERFQRPVPVASVKMTQTVVPVAYSPESDIRPENITKHAFSSSRERFNLSTDLEEVKARNRRLEALVKVLRRRSTDERLTPASRSEN